MPFDPLAMAAKGGAEKDAQDDHRDDLYGVGPGDVNGDGPQRQNDDPSKGTSSPGR